MERIERESYKKKIKLCESLGALEFQSVVFKVEKIKFKVLKRVFPNFIKYYDKYCENVRKETLNQAKTEEEKRNINRNVNFAKLEMRRELNTGKNRNYHINLDNSTEIYEYLNYNKKIHKQGLIKNAIAIPAITTASIILTPWLIPLLAYEMISAFVNFQCINIQNYNMYRYKLIEEKLVERQERKIKKTNEEYGDVAEVIQDKLETKKDLPSITEIIDSLDSESKLNKLKELLLKEKQEREIEKNKLLIRGNK